jgi:SAM-dependent methyltransferase
MLNENPGRNLFAYLDSYRDLPFETVQEMYRRRSLINFLDKGNYRVATEIGCGRSSLFEFWSPAQLAQTIEPLAPLLDSVNGKTIPGVEWRGFNCRAEEAATNPLIAKSDLTILSGILHEVENPQELLSSMREITKPDGLMVIIVTNKLSLHRILGVHRGILESLDSKTHTEIKMQQRHGAYSHEELSAELKDAKLELIEMRSLFPKLFAHEQMGRLLESKKISMEFLDVMEGLSSELIEFGSELFAIARRPID